MQVLPSANDQNRTSRKVLAVERTFIVGWTVVVIRNLVARAKVMQRPANDNAL